MTWKGQFEAWCRQPYPSCPAEVSGVDLVSLDAAIAGLLTRVGQKAQQRDAILEFQLAALRDQLGLALPSLIGECAAYFGELEQCVDLVLAEHMPSH